MSIQGSFQGKGRSALALNMSLHKFSSVSSRWIHGRSGIAQDITLHKTRDISLNEPLEIFLTQTPHGFEILLADATMVYQEQAA
ncbi:hypothetical protein PG991_016110 [Apiospora marii]|uniref:Uncharacterized protein n=1 Tax=Apiospora marii TaxID=335849 RepID=A0ABR1R0L3_9PEZI